MELCRYGLPKYSYQSSYHEPGLSGPWHHCTTLLIAEDDDSGVNYNARIASNLIKGRTTFRYATSISPKAQGNIRFRCDMLKIENPNDILLSDAHLRVQEYAVNEDVDLINFCQLLKNSEISEISGKPVTEYLIP